jgi:hypothetical protein
LLIEQVWQAAWPKNQLYAIKSEKFIIAAIRGGEENIFSGKY